MRPSSLGGDRILRRTLSVRLSVRLSVCLSVRPVIVLSLPSVTSRHLANYNDTCTFRHALRAAYRTAISAVQILVYQNSADIRISRTFCGGFSAASIIAADMANFRRLRGLIENKKKTLEYLVWFT